MNSNESAPQEDVDEVSEGASTTEQQPQPVVPAPGVPAPESIQPPTNEAQIQHERLLAEKEAQTEKEKKLKPLDDTIRYYAELANKKQLESLNKYKKKSFGDHVVEGVKRGAKKALIGGTFGTLIGGPAGTVAGVAGAVGSELAIGAVKGVKAGVEAIKKKIHKGEESKEETLRVELEGEYAKRNQKLGSMAVATLKVMNLPPGGKIEYADENGTAEYTADELRLKFLEYITEISNPESEVNKALAEKEKAHEDAGRGWRFLEGVASIVGGVLSGHWAADAMHQTLQRSIEHAGVNIKGQGIGDITQYGSKELQHMQQLGHTVHLNQGQMVFDYHHGEVSEILKAVNNESTPAWLKEAFEKSWSVLNPQGAVQMHDAAGLAEKFSQVVNQAVGTRITEIVVSTGLASFIGDLLGGKSKKGKDIKSLDKDALKAALPQEGIPVAPNAATVANTSSAESGRESGETEVSPILVGRRYASIASFQTEVGGQQMLIKLDQQVRVKGLAEGGSKVEVEILDLDHLDANGEPGVLPIGEPLYFDSAGFNSVFKIVPEPQLEQTAGAGDPNQKPDDINIDLKDRAIAEKLNEKYAGKLQKGVKVDEKTKTITLTDDEGKDVKLKINQDKRNALYGNNVELIIDAIIEGEKGPEVQISPVWLKDRRYAHMGDFGQGQKEDNLHDFISQADVLEGKGRKVVLRSSNGQLYEYLDAEPKDGQKGCSFSLVGSRNPQPEFVSNDVIYESAVDWYIEGTKGDGDTKEKSGLSEIDKSQSEEIISKTEIHGHRFKDNKLTIDMLKAADLGPKYKAEIGDQNVYFSETYAMPTEGGRIGVVGYVETGEGDKKAYVARTYYRSNSQGVWRYMPSYLTTDDEQDIDWYNKSRGEESVTLPYQEQKVLAQISKNIPKTLEKLDSQLVFAGTAKDMKKLMTDTVSLEQQHEPENLNGNFYGTEDGKKNPPESMNFNNPDQEPDFSGDPVATWIQPTQIYGDVNISVYSSKNGKLNYLFCEAVVNSKEKIWIGGIEMNGEIGSTGVRNVWVKGGDLTTPAYEYAKQAGGYGDPSDSVGRYVDVYEKYISKIPVIEKYKSEVVRKRTEATSTFEIKFDNGDVLRVEPGAELSIMGKPIKITAVNMLPDGKINISKESDAASGKPWKARTKVEWSRVLNDLNGAEYRNIKG